MMQAIPAAVTALGGWGTALAVAGTVYSTMASYQQGMYQSKVAANNAQVAEENAKRARQEAAVKAQEQDFNAQAEMGALLANLGASGLNLGTGSAALRRKSQQELAARDRGYTIYEGDTAAAAYQQQAQDFRTEAAGNRMAARNSLVSGIFDIGGSLISGASKVNMTKAKKMSAGIKGSN